MLNTTMQAAFTRREFVHRGLAVVSTAATIPTFLHQSAYALVDPDDMPLIKDQPGIPQDRILVVVQLSGGNDGLNTVVPYGNPAYHNARPGLALRENQVLPLDGGDGIGLHWQLEPLREMIGEGLASIIQGVGYPNPNRSHFASMDIYHTCQARGGKGLGWLGQLLDQIDPTNGTSLVALSGEAPLAGQGHKTQPIAFENPKLFRWIGSEMHAALEARYQQISRDSVDDPNGINTLIPQPDNPRSFIRRTALDAQVASQAINEAVAQGSVTSYPGGQLSEQLRMVGAMIRAGLGTRVFYVGLNGFDTHAGQAGRHANLLRQFAVAMQAFYRELQAIGQDQRVLTLAFSEFGRRVGQNASQGTDHGTAGPMFMFGPMIRAGLLGKHPSLAKLDQGDLIYNVDFRSVYAAVMEKWLKADSRKVLGKTFRPANILKNV